MKKNIFRKIALVLILLLVSFSVAHAFDAGKRFFGGKITKTKATQIETLESSGYNCQVNGSTVEISPVGPYPTSYLIPSSVESKTGKTLTVGGWILGLYGLDKEIVTCTKECGETECTETVTLDKISLFGNS